MAAGVTNDYGIWSIGSRSNRSQRHPAVYLVNEFAQEQEPNTGLKLAEGIGKRPAAISTQQGDCQPTQRDLRYVFHQKGVLLRRTRIASDRKTVIRKSASGEKLQVNVMQGRLKNLLLAFDVSKSHLD